MLPEQNLLRENMMINVDVRMPSLEMMLELQDMLVPFWHRGGLRTNCMGPYFTMKGQLYGRFETVEQREADLAMLDKFGLLVVSRQDWKWVFRVKIVTYKTDMPVIEGVTS